MFYKDKVCKFILNKSIKTILKDNIVGESILFPSPSLPVSVTLFYVWVNRVISGLLAARALRGGRLFLLCYVFSWVNYGCVIARTFLKSWIINISKIKGYTHHWLFIAQAIACKASQDEWVSNFSPHNITK